MRRGRTNGADDPGQKGVVTHQAHKLHLRFVDLRLLLLDEHGSSLDALGNWSQGWHGKARGMAQQGPRSIAARSQEQCSEAQRTARRGEAPGTTDGSLARQLSLTFAAAAEQAKSSGALARARSIASSASACALSQLSRWPIARTWGATNGKRIIVYGCPMGCVMVNECAHWRRVGCCQLVGAGTGRAHAPAACQDDWNAIGGTLGTAGAQYLAPT